MTVFILIFDFCVLWIFDHLQPFRRQVELVNRDGLFTIGDSYNSYLIIIKI